MLPFRLFAGSGVQANPVESSFIEISTSGAVIGFEGSDSSPGVAAYGPLAPTLNGAAKYRSLFMAPMVMASGVVPGDPIAVSYTHLDVYKRQVLVKPRGVREARR